MRILSTSIILGAFAGALVITGCALHRGIATSANFPIETIPAAGGSIASVHTSESGDLLFVSGTARAHAGYHLPVTAHVDVQLIGRGGEVIAERQVSIARRPHLVQVRRSQIPYAASFPVRLKAEAVGVRIRYHSESHALANS